MPIAFLCSESLKDSRVGKLHRKRPRTESMQNLLKEPEKQAGHPALLDALNGLLTTYSKKRPRTANVQGKRKATRPRKRIPQERTTSTRTLKKRRTYRKNRHIHTHTVNPLDHNPLHYSKHSNHNNTTENNTDDNELVILAKQTKLTDTQKNILRKGLSFIPKPKHLYI